MDEQRHNLVERVEKALAQLEWRGTGQWQDDGGDWRAKLVGVNGGALEQGSEEEQSSATLLLILAMLKSCPRG